MFGRISKAYRPPAPVSRRYTAVNCSSLTERNSASSLCDTPSTRKRVGDSTVIPLTDTFRTPSTSRNRSMLVSVSIRKASSVCTRSTMCTPPLRSSPRRTFSPGG